MNEDDPRDLEIIEALDVYLKSIQHGENPDQDQLLKTYPELVSLLGCLHQLDRIAGDSTLSLPPDHQEMATIPPSGAIFPEAIQPTQSFGEYELVEEVGRGGMGIVYRARQHGLDREVAIKMILSNHMASDEELQRFRDESKAIAQLHHPNIVAVHEAGELDNQHYFVMDFLGGPSLGELIKQGPIAPEQAARFAAQIAEAAAHLHHNGIIHRDLKPSNILLDVNGHPYVTDFGLVKFFRSESHVTRTGAIAGTPSYMAPEQASGKADHVTPLSDVYSIGAILYELLVSQPPFRESNALDTIVKVIEAEPTRPRDLRNDIPSDLEQICLKCLEKEPSRRYQSATDLADDLNRFLHAEPVEARPSNIVLRVRRWSRREPALFSRVAAIALVFPIVQTRYHLSSEQDLALHIKVLVLMSAWIVCSVVLQRFMRISSVIGVVRFVWAFADVSLLTGLIGLVDGGDSPIVGSLAALIAASGLWYREHLVWFVTVCCVISYVLLEFMVLEQIEYIHFSILFGVMLPVIGAVVAHLVRRVRALSRYYESFRS